MGTGQRVSALRRAAGISQAELARRVGITPPHVSRLEAGKSDNLTAEVVVKLADALRTTTDHLLTGAGPNEPSDEWSGSERRRALQETYKALIQEAEQLDEMALRVIDEECCRLVRLVASERKRLGIANAKNQGSLGSFKAN